MKLTGVYLADNLSYSGRLLKGDIMRLPSAQTNKADFYMPVKPSPSRKRTVFLRNLFTALTFGFTGLYIAHRNDLFNPIRREAKRLIKSDTFISKIKTFVDSSLNPQTYREATKKSLEMLAGNKSRGEEFVSEAKRILASDKDFADVLKEATKKFADDADIQRLKDGYSVDLLDKLVSKVEKLLRGIKESGQNYRNKDGEILTTLFTSNDGKNSIAKDVLVEIIENRGSVPIEKFVNDSWLKSKIGK